MIRPVHPIAASVALALIAIFWSTTVASELFGTRHAIVVVKTLLPWGLLGLIPCLIITAATGFQLSRRWKTPLVQAKKRRMPFIAANGICVLTPCALILAHLARTGSFGSPFLAVQTLELVAGAVNIVLLTMSFRDGLRLRGRLPHGRKAS